MKIVTRTLAVVFAFMLPGSVGWAQLPQTSGADTSTNKTARKISDTGFINNNIKQQILVIKLAQLAVDKAERPRVKQVARTMIVDSRDHLKRLLSLTNGKNLPGVSQAELRQALGNANGDSALSSSDPRAAATSGNTITDSLGSGSTGSGNVKGEDTGTLARTSSDKEDPNYAETGNDYAYNNRGILNEADLLNNESRSFDARWVQMMLRFHKGELDLYNDAVDQVKDQKLKVVITQALPKIRMHNGTLLRLSKDRDISDGHENRKGGDQQNNTR